MNNIIKNRLKSKKERKKTRIEPKLHVPNAKPFITKNSLFRCYHRTDAEIHNSRPSTAILQNFIQMRNNYPYLIIKLNLGKANLRSKFCYKCSFAGFIFKCKLCWRSFHRQCLNKVRCERMNRVRLLSKLQVFRKHLV